MVGGAAVAEAVGHRLEEDDAQAARGTLVGGRREVCGRALGGIEGLAVVVDGECQLVVGHRSLKVDGGGLTVVDGVDDGPTVARRDSLLR